MKKLLISLCMVTSLSCYTWGIGYIQPNDSAGFPGEYLMEFGANARALAMGRAYTAVASGSSGIYWNPAGLASLVYREGTFLYARLFEDVNYNFVSFGYPFAQGKVLGICRSGFSIDEIPKTDSTGEKGTFKDTEGTYFVSYGHNFPVQKLSAGVNLKMVMQDMDIYSSIGFGMDIGFIYQPLDRLSLGMNFQNVVPARLTLKDETDVFPVCLKTGVAWTPFDNFLFVCDVDFVNLFPDKDLYEDGKTSRPIRWHSGLEYNAGSMFSLRVGLDYKEITGGVGIATRDWAFDYACGFHHLGITHGFGLSGRFGILPTEEEKIIAENRRQMEIERHYNLSLRAFNAADYGLARSEAKKALKLEPEHHGASELLDKINLLDRQKKAREIYEDGLLDMTSGRERNAREKIRRATELDPEVGEKLEEEYFHSAKDYLDIRDYENARSDFIKVLQINPDNKTATELLKKIESILEFVK